MNKKRKQTIEANEISEIVELTLGGFPQKILIDGRRKENPLVLCLHGGPGTPIPFSVGSRGLFPEITERFTLVCWDQLGCGINDRPIGDEFHISDFVTMTRDLIRAIRERFPENRLILVGMSWGSILALEASALSDGVIVYGQILHDIPFNESVYRALENAKMPQKKREEFERIKNEPCMENSRRLMGFIQKYTEGYFAKTAEKSPMGAMLLGLLQSPDYRFRDFKATVVNGYRKNRSLLEELFRIDLREALSAVSVPYTIIQGETDLVTPTEMIAEFLKDSQNEKIRFVTVPRSGHIPGGKGMDVLMEEVARLVI